MFSQSQCIKKKKTQFSFVLFLNFQLHIMGNELCVNFPCLKTVLIWSLSQRSTLWKSQSSPVILCTLAQNKDNEKNTGAKNICRYGSCCCVCDGLVRRLKKEVNYRRNEVGGRLTGYSAANLWPMMG